MSRLFNTYIDNPEIRYWKQMCLQEGELRHFDKGEEFVTAGSVARYVGFIKCGTLKYVAYGADGTEHVVGFEFENGFVADFPFSIRGAKSFVSIVADSACEIYCVPVLTLAERVRTDTELDHMVAYVSELLFIQTYHRYMSLYCKTAQERYNDLISRHPDLFNLFSLKDIASFLNVTPTHLSRLRKNIS